MTTPILLTTLNSRYHHTAFGLRYLYANLKELQGVSKILEFTINQNPKDIVECLLRHNPQIIGFGVYIWNTRPIQEVISILKKLRPEVLVVLGGPEISYETEIQELYRLADFVICGEADFSFYDFCKNFLENRELPKSKVVSANLPEIGKISLPYDFYSDEDIKNRIIYVEASRGCPYKCEYCLSSLDKSVRSFDLEKFLAKIEALIQRGAKQFKFVDRTFNLSISTSSRILEFFLSRISNGLFLHFEMVPDRLPKELRDLIRKFPPGSLQFEVGIQTWNPEVAKLVSRRQDYLKIKENFSFLKSETSVHIHADLIVGLPGETIYSFADGFDEVYSLRPDEIQVGILKRLKGTPIIRHDKTWQMIYQDVSPFQILQTKTMNFNEIQEMSRFAHFWDLFANSGNFKGTLELLSNLAQERSDHSLFWLFYDFSKFLAFRHPQGHGVALLNLVESVWIYLTEELQYPRIKARETLIRDYTGNIKRDIPRFLRAESFETENPFSQASLPLKAESSTPKRQLRHLS